ncbi:hypothetical protein BTM22_25360, partial [Vibrio parahaemolyticus]
LPPDEKNKIELDKQASFLVWKLREAKSGPEAIEEQLSKINDAGLNCSHSTAISFFTDHISKPYLKITTKNNN